MTNQDVERTRQIYQECLKLLPHKKFTFAKVWLMTAQFEIRQGQLQAARKTLGRALGMCPKDKLFKGYIELELKLFEFVRVRTLYEKYIEWNPANCQAWIKFAELERGLDDLDRTRAIFELAVEQPQLDMPELLWKSYIDFEEEEGEYDRTRQLYERLLQKTDHVKVWISWAQFEIGVPEDDEEGDEEEERPVSEEAKARARKIFERAYKSMKEKDLKEEVSLVLVDLQIQYQYLTMVCRESPSSMHGSHLRRRTGLLRTSKRSMHKCRARSRSGGNWTMTHSKSIWITCSQQTTRVQPRCRSCFKWHTNGSRSKPNRMEGLRACSIGLRPPIMSAVI